ncbi:MAG: hypothetical protein RLZZ46_926 [Bacteroidota bacterium]|jgi:predicted SprT family Zn-dependent metalloprotease
MNQEVLRKKFEHLLSGYVPPEAANILSSWIIELNFDLHISHERHSKYGDYRFGNGYRRPRISVNHNLNPYAFLITLVHEIAHLTAHKKHGDKIKPHGLEWKQEFRMAMRPFILKKIFPDSLEIALDDYLLNPAASSCSDDNLLRCLKKFDKTSSSLVHLEELPEGAVFTASRGREFTKGPRVRKRYRCRENNSGHFYLFSPVAEVNPVLIVTNNHKLPVANISEGSIFFDNSGKSYKKIEPFGSGFRCMEISTGKAYWFNADTMVNGAKG